MTERVLTPAEVGERLRAGRNTTYDLISSGAIRSVRLGSGPRARIRVPESAVDDYIAGRPASLIASVGNAADD